MAVFTSRSLPVLFLCCYVQVKSQKFECTNPMRNWNYTNETYELASCCRTIRIECCCYCIYISVSIWLLHNYKHSAHSRTVCWYKFMLKSTCCCFFSHLMPPISCLQISEIHDRMYFPPVLSQFAHRFSYFVVNGGCSAMQTYLCVCMHNIFTLYPFDIL